MRRGSPLKAAHVGRPGRTGGSSKQRGGSAPAADICRERVSCKIRVRPTLEKSASGQVELSNWEKAVCRAFLQRTFDLGPSMNKALMHKSFAQQTDLMAKKVEYVSRYKVHFINAMKVKLE